MGSFIDAFARQQLDEMLQLQRDFGRRPPRREPSRRGQRVLVALRGAMAARWRAWAVRLHPR